MQHEADLMLMQGEGFKDSDEPQKLELAIDHVHKSNLRKSKNQDKDYERDDLDEADEEELEDKIIAESRRLSRPLRIEEVNRISQSTGMGS